MTQPDTPSSCHSAACQGLLIALEAARAELVQNTADITHGLDSRNQNGVVAGFSVGAAAAGAGLLGSTAAYARTVGAALIGIAIVIVAIVLSRAISDYLRLGAARKRCKDVRRRYLETVSSVMGTCPHACWPGFIDSSCQ